MNPNIIAFSGAHGTGKTTSVYSMAEKLKKDGLNVGIILETARECPFPVMSKTCHEPVKEAQLWIFTRQIQAELEASRKYDVVVSDRSIIDCIAYTRFHRYSSLGTDMEAIAQHHKKIYRQIIVNSIETHNYCLDDGFRSMDMLSRKTIEETLIHIYRYLNIPITVN